MLVPKNVQYCTLNCERRQISKCLDVMKKKIPRRSSNNLQIIWISIHKNEKTKGKNKNNLIMKERKTQIKTLVFSKSHA